MKSDKKEFLVKKLESVGKTTLVKYFDLFNDYKNFRSNSDIKEAFKEEKWLEDSINTKASVGKNIFYKGLEWNALELIIQSKKLHSDIISTAEDILKRKEEYINSESEIGVTVLKSGNLAILARELIYWITMQEDLAKELILDKVITNAKSDDIIEYSCRQFGKGTFIYAVNSRKAKIENKNVFSSPFNPHTFEIYNDKNNFYLTNEWSKKAHNFNIDKVVDFINENSDNFEVNIKYGNINFLYIKDKEVFECANLTEEESIQGKNENQENSKTQKVIGNIDKYKYKEDRSEERRVGKECRL